MKDFYKVTRYWTEEIPYYTYWEQASMEEAEDGGWVEYEDYSDLLEAYTELKWRMDSTNTEAQMSKGE